MGEVTGKLRGAFFIFNLLFLGAGAGMVGVGAYVVQSMATYGPYAAPQFRTAPSLMIIAGSLHIIMGIMGLVLTFFNHKLLLLTYSVAVIVIMLLTYATAIVGFLDRPKVRATVNTLVNDTFTNNATFNAQTPLLQQLQKQFNCCDITGYQKFLSSTAATAMCAGAVANNERFIQLPVACPYYISTAITELLYKVGAISMGFGTFELTSLLVFMQNLEGAEGGSS
ncbi:hypothetical protein EMCRGX_G009392 [Ephydatia muelleri]